MTNNQLSWQTKDGLKVFAQEWLSDEKSNAVIALVHGLGEHTGRYHHVANFFNRARFVVLGYDVRGHGKTEGQRGHSPSYEMMMEDIDLLLSQAAQRYPKLPIFLYGHSMGGQQVLAYGFSRQPKIKGIIATSPWLAPAIPVPAWKTQIGKILYNLYPTMSMDTGLEQDALSHDPEVIKAYINDPLVHSKVSARYATDFFNQGEALLHKSTNSFPVPLLIMWGSEDRISSPIAINRFASNLKGDVTSKEWKQLYHEIHNEPEKQDVFKVILDWLKKHL